jgi:hypothetical protein
MFCLPVLRLTNLWEQTTSRQHIIKTSHFLNFSYSPSCHFIHGLHVIFIDADAACLVDCASFGVDMRAPLFSYIFGSYLLGSVTWYGLWL